MGNVSRIHQEIDEMGLKSFDPAFWHRKAVDSAKRMVEERASGGDHFHAIFAEEARTFAALAESANTCLLHLWNTEQTPQQGYETVADGT
jgi:hypothetical protein